MAQPILIDFSQHRRNIKKTRTRAPINTGKKKGRVYNRGEKLWVDFHYMGSRVREPSGLIDTPDNRQKLRGQLDLIMAEIENGVFEFAHRFPHSSNKLEFTELEGRTLTKMPNDVTFGEYLEKWWEDMTPGMTSNQIRDYTCILNHHLKPFFNNKTFADFTPVLVKKFVASLKSQEGGTKTTLSAKRIQNIMIPIRIITRDAIAEHGWNNYPDPFIGLKLPKVPKFRVFPFDFNEWKILQDYINPWYRPYFEFAVQTGLRPSEQVALKWQAIDDYFIHIELSRVRNKEKTDLKTEDSRRSIAIRPAMAATIKTQRKLTMNVDSPYVFINTEGRPILQDKLRELWARAMKKSGLKYR
ncbi:MAG: DUF3596 domain-containing protein [Proteobacteria bacterium]|nr:DUF3596 domain-containing protein [Pseudomonadota bacterium]